MARYRFKTKEELVRDFGVGWQNQSPSWNDHMKLAIGRPIDEVFNSNEVASAIMIIEGNATSLWDEESWIYAACRISERSASSWAWDKKWFVRIDDGINVVFIHLGDKQVSKGQVYIHSKKLFLVEQINKKGNKIILNNKHNLADCDIVDESIKKDLL